MNGYIGLSRRKENMEKRAIISVKSFSDIDPNEAIEVVTPGTFIIHDEGFKAIYEDPTSEIEINLVKQTITLLATGAQESFDINDYKKENMLNGFDDIDYLQNLKGDIQEFAKGLPL